MLRIILVSHWAFCHPVWNQNCSDSSSANVSNFIQFFFRVQTLNFIYNNYLDFVSVRHGRNLMLEPWKRIDLNSKSWQHNHLSRIDFNSRLNSCGSFRRSNVFFCAQLDAYDNGSAGMQTVKFSTWYCNIKFHFPSTNDKQMSPQCSIQVSTCRLSCVKFTVLLFFVSHSR